MHSYTMTPTSFHPTLGETKYITLTETFSAGKLNYIVKHEDELKALLRPSCFDGDWNPFALMRKYQRGSHLGTITVKYRQNQGFGRFYAEGGLSLQSLPREIRHTIGCGYTDIDMVNAHPVILEHICRGIIATPYLSSYVNRRDELLAELGDREKAKIVILSLINGGTSAYKDIENKPEWLSAFKDEIEMIHDVFARGEAFNTHKAKREVEGKTNHKASFINTILCNFENKILQELYSYFGSPKDAVLCFDGIMIRTDEFEAKLDLDGAEDHVYQALGIKIKLKVKEMNEGLDVPDEAYQECYNFDFDDPYTYADFQRDYKEKFFDDYKKLDNALSDVYPRVIARVLSGEGSYVKKLKDGKIDVVKSLGNSGFDMFYMTDGAGKQRKKKISLKDYLHKQNGYAGFECVLANPDRSNFNLFTGFQARANAGPLEASGAGLERMKQFFLETWASGNQDYYNYLISWFAGVVRTGDINRVALAMVSQQGSGKGFFLEFFRLVMGNINVAEVVGVQSITQKHNTILQGKRLVVVNELCSVKDEFKSNFDKIKAFITDPYITIEPKGLSPYSINNISNFILATNQRDSIIVEKKDRRYAIFEVSSAHLNDTVYFQKLADDCMNQETANGFYKYLLDFPMVNLRVIPNTEIRQEMTNLSMPNTNKFIEAALRREEVHFSEEQLEEGITGAELYRKYTMWCSENGERPVSGTKFGIVSKGLLEHRRTRSGVVYKIPPVSNED